MLKFYGSSLIFAAIAVIIGYVVAGFNGVGVVIVLGVLETSLSFDNAVVNASVLQHWSEKWRRRFLVWGMPVAVFGMRLVFPLLIVGIVAGIGPLEAFRLAIYESRSYEQILTSVHHEISAFGGAFLLMVFLKFFFDHRKETHWVIMIERPLARLGRLEGIQIAVALGAILLSGHFIDPTERLSFTISGVWGLITFIIADSIGSLVGGDSEPATGRIIKEGAGGFMYLELLDASFSFDGVIAAFALTNNIFIIMLGLAIGAMFVRSITLHMVNKGTLSQFRYLEHSAFWAIGALATIMFTSVVVHVPELITGLIGAVLIGSGVYHSHVENKRNVPL